MSEAGPLLEVRGLRVEYPVSAHRRLRAVHEVSFALWPGCILGIVGESGCGKTSLVRALLGLLPAAAGSVWLRGRDLAAMTPSARRAERRHVQHVFQDPAGSLSPRRTVGQTLQEPLQLYRLGTRAGWPERIARALGTVGLQPDVLPRFPHELSGGQRQRIALARALIAEPDLIVADEPTASLDASAQATVIGLIRRVREELGVAFLLISHDLAAVQQLADNVGVMYLGRLVECAPAAALFATPAHPYTQALLAAATGVAGDGGDAAALRGDPPSPLTPPPGCVFHTRCPRFMDRCSRDAPDETVLRQQPGEREAHRVRCLLWS